MNDDNSASNTDVPENELLDNERVLKGRGAISNPANRYHPHSSIDVDDGWSRDEVSSTVPTQLIAEQSKTIISSNKSPDIPFSKSINPYRGCEHGCVRPTHAYCLAISVNLFVLVPILTRINLRIVRSLSHVRF